MYMNINEFKLFLIRSIVWTSMRPKWQYNNCIFHPSWRFLENSSKNLYGILIFGSRANPLGWVFQKSVFAMPQKSNNGDWIRFPEIGPEKVFQKNCPGNLPRVNIDFFIRWHSFRTSFDTQILQYNLMFSTIPLGWSRLDPFYFWNQLRKEADPTYNDSEFRWLDLQSILIRSWNLISETFYVGSASFWHWFRIENGLAVDYP